jgi:putative transposase
MSCETASALGLDDTGAIKFIARISNCERPPEALDLHTPASRYVSSPRQLPNTPPPLQDPDRFEVRYVSAHGGLRWHRQWVNVSSCGAGEYVGLEDIDEGVWNVSFGPLKRGRLRERHRRIEDASGRLTRHR